MIRAIWDRLFVRRQWEIIEKRELIRTKDGALVGWLFVMRDQFGNIKHKRTTV